MLPTRETALSILSSKGLAHLHATVVVEELRRGDARLRVAKLTRTVESGEREQS